jgi:Ca2+-binding EF-hand superfamily protein
MATSNEKAQRRISQNLGNKIDVTKLQPSKGHALLKEGHVTNKAIIRSVFRKHNHDDVLNDHELQGILVDLELPKEIFNPETNRALMLLLDKDGSGEVDFEEFFSWWSAMCGDNVDNIDLTIVNLGQLYVGMKSFTDNKDGTLDFPNFAALWEYCGNDADTAEDVFDELDTDGGGTITFQGMKKFL